MYCKSLDPDVGIALAKRQITIKEAWTEMKRREESPAGYAYGNGTSRRCSDKQRRRNYKAAAAWIENEGSSRLKEILELHKATVESRAPAEEGGDGSLSMCVVARRRNDIVRLAIKDGCEIDENAPVEESDVAGQSSVESSSTANADDPGEKISTVPSMMIPSQVSVDLVVPLGTGTADDDWELKMLLRSASENLIGLRKIHIIGPVRPKWLNEHPQIVYHSWLQMEPKNHDIIAKFIYAANRPDVSSVFVGTCDDWLFLRPIRPMEDWGAVQRGGVLTTNDKTYWDKCQSGTRRVLEEAGKPVLFYDTHIPSVMTKSGWLKVDRSVDWRSSPKHAVWSLYHNTAGVHGPVLGRQPLVSKGWHSAKKGSEGPKTAEEAAAALEGRFFSAYNNAGLTRGLREWLESRFPGPAPWERQMYGPAMFCAFNEAFVKYAAVCIYSTLKMNPDYVVHAFATNVPEENFKMYPFNDPRVQIHAEHRKFDCYEDERCYMNSRRFLRYIPLLSKVRFAVLLDVDQVVLLPFTALENSMVATDSDVGLVRRPGKPRRSQIRACTLACRPTKAAERFWEAYEPSLPKTRQWFADQLALADAHESLGTSLKTYEMSERLYSSFRRRMDTCVLVTSTWNKFGCVAYKKAFNEMNGIIEKKRQLEKKK